MTALITALTALKWAALALIALIGGLLLYCALLTRECERHDDDDIHPDR